MTNYNNTNPELDPLHFKAYEVPIDAIPAARTGSIKTAWSNNFLKRFMDAKVKCWRVTENEKGPINTVKDADNTAKSPFAQHKAHPFLL